MSVCSEIVMPAYVFVFDQVASRWTLSLPAFTEAFCVSSCPLMLSPQIPGVRLDISSVEHLQVGDTHLLRGALQGEAQGWVENEIYFLANRIVCQSRYTIDRSHALSAWDCLLAGSVLRADSVHGYIGHHNTPGEGTLLPLADAEVSTRSHNWSYCTLAPRLLFQRDCFMVTVGGTTISHDYGLCFKMRQGQLEHCYYDYGTEENPLSCPANEVIKGPRQQISFARNTTVHEANLAFTEAMIADGICSVKHYRPEEAVWRLPYYCTWGDQVLLAKRGFQQDVSRAQHYQDIKSTLTSESVLAAAKKIRALDLNIGTIIIDDGWQDFRGDWNLVHARFPDMRQLTDSLHAMGFRVALWWAPVATEAEAMNAGLDDICSGDVQLNKRIIDYSKPKARIWLEEKLHLWWGNYPGGWNIDGFKLDFLVDRVKPYNNLGDVEWRGEERLFFNLLQTIHRIALQYHNAPGILTAPYNPHLAPFLTTVFQEERFDEELTGCYRTTEIARVMLPGVRVTPHFLYQIEALAPYLRMCQSLDTVPQLGVLLAPEATDEMLAVWPRLPGKQ